MNQAWGRPAIIAYRFLKVLKPFVEVGTRQTAASSKGAVSHGRSKEQLYATVLRALDASSTHEPTVNTDE